jgi:putative oxidoreductase
MFIMAGIQKFTDISGTAGYITSVGLPAGTVLAVLSGLWETLAGIAVLIGFRTQIASYALALFCVLTAVLFHWNFADMTQMLFFMKDLATAGGFLALSVAGGGAWSVDSRRGG